MPRRSLAALRRELPKQAVCRTCGTEYTTDGLSSVENHCDQCGWNFLCPTCTGPLPDPDDIVGIALWLKTNRPRIHTADCPVRERPLTQDSMW